MSLKPLFAVAALIALSLFEAAQPGLAQTAPHRAHTPRIQYVRPRIEITPRPLYSRRCTDWLELQNRPSGPVLYPLTYCWWVRG